MIQASLEKQEEKETPLLSREGFFFCKDSQGYEVKFHGLRVHIGWVNLSKPSKEPSKAKIGCDHKEKYSETGYGSPRIFFTYWTGDLETFLAMVIKRCRRKVIEMLEFNLKKMVEKMGYGLVQEVKSNSFMRFDKGSIIQAYDASINDQKFSYAMSISVEGIFKAVIKRGYSTMTFKETKQTGRTAVQIEMAQTLEDIAKDVI